MRLAGCGILFIVRTMPSTVIADFEYDVELKELTVRFTSGRIYRYAGVPEATADEFSQVRSKGAFFNRRIRDQFPYTELPGPA